GRADAGQPARTGDRAARSGFRAAPGEERRDASAHERDQPGLLFGRNASDRRAGRTARDAARRNERGARLSAHSSPTGGAGLLDLADGADEQHAPAGRSYSRPPDHYGPARYGLRAD